MTIFPVFCRAMESAMQEMGVPWSFFVGTKTVSETVVKVFEPETVTVELSGLTSKNNIKNKANKKGENSACKKFLKSGFRPVQEINFLAF